MALEIPLLPLDMIQNRLATVPHLRSLTEFQTWWTQKGQAISEAVDRAGTPALRLFDRFGKRVDEILYPPEYWEMLSEGYRAGVIWRWLEEESLLTPYLLGYIVSYFDPGLYCPYVVSLSTAVPLAKYGSHTVTERFLPPLLQKEGTAWQGATWMTESGGGSDLGGSVQTLAADCGDHWELTGDKYFCSNVGAELAVVAARPEHGPAGLRGLELFLTPRLREDGSLNYLVRRLKDKVGTRSVPTGEVELRSSEAYLLGKRGQGVYLILETLNLSRVGNCMGSVALAQRALAEAWRFSQGRTAFGKPVAEHPLLRKQFEERWETLQQAWALAWEAATLLNQVWREPPPYSERYHLFRLVAHLAKYWTAELAVQYAKWAVEVHGGAGIVADLPVERLLREAIILPIWEGTPHRQILDGMEVMERRRAHHLLMNHLADRGARTQDLAPLLARLDAWLKLPQPEREENAEAEFRHLAETVAQVLVAV